MSDDPRLFYSFDEIKAEIEYQYWNGFAVGCIITTVSFIAGIAGWLWLITPGEFN